MPIGAIIGGVASIGGSLLASSSNNKAINKASAAQQQATAEQTALTRDIYNQNKAIFTPAISRGDQAGEAINNLLGLGTGTDWNAYINADPAAYNDWKNNFPSWTADQYGQWHWNTDGQRRDLTPYSKTAQAKNAFDMFRNSAGYQFRFGEGQRALNGDFAGKGVYQSGARDKALTKYGQNFASNELANYMGYLGNQQAAGVAGGSALAGVGTNYNSTMNGISQNNANALASAAGLKAQNNNAMWSGIAGGIGGALGAFGGGSSYGIGG